MFCVAQFASITGGIFVAYKARNVFLMMAEGYEYPEDVMPTTWYLFLYFGWWLILIPIACVFLIPRRTDEDGADSVEWNKYSNSVRALGWLTTVLPLAYGISMFYNVLTQY